MIADETLTILSQLVGRPLAAYDAESIFLHLNAENAFAPNAMVGGLVELLQLRYDATEHNEKVEPIFADILARDRHTGYYIHGALRALYLDFVMTRAGLPGQENKNFLILGDYMNLSSVNEAIGRSSTNDVMATICGIYLDCMIRAGVVNWLYHRSMGDEVTFIVVNTPEENVLNGLKEAERITEEFVQALGLERLRHKKYPNQFGTGLITAHINLVGDMNHRTLKQELDDIIQTKKRTRHTRRWFNFARPGIEPDQFHNRSSEQRIDKALHKFRHYRNTSQFAGDIDPKVGTRSALNPAKSLLVGRAIAWPRDDRIEYLRYHHNDTKIMLRADIYNLGGLNSVFGHDGADTIKAHLIRILYNTLAAYDMGEPKIFDCGGGIIDIVVNTMASGEINKVIEAIQSNIYYQILSHTVAGYADAYNLSFSGNGDIVLSNLHHPRHENHGTGLVMATHKVESSRSLPEIIERLDKITHRTKMHDFAYLWADDSDHVFALRLNEVPDPVFIGSERKNHSPHYLPYTDALRHYLEEDDLPSIFERPVGQICETFFGTDMQAVLGFKKAIRLLQDKKIPDEEIENIRSYEQMDEKLRTENLPPLSVVSTQNRPSFVNNERPSFRTMALAEKLEDLPSVLTRLILQAQASFRTLKVIQPHGHLPPAQAAQVLVEEIHQTRIPDANTSNAGEQLTESMYALARLFDRGYTALHKDVPDSLREAMRGFSLSVLRDLAHAFAAADENFLGEKLHTYTLREIADYPDRLTSLNRIRQEIAPVIDKLQKKQMIEAAELNRMQETMSALWHLVRGHVQASHTHAVGK